MQYERGVQNQRGEWCAEEFGCCYVWGAELYPGLSCLLKTVRMHLSHLQDAGSNICSDKILIDTSISMEFLNHSLLREELIRHDR